MVEKKSVQGRGWGEQYFRFENTVFFHEEKILILDYSIFFSLHQPWSFFTFEILILCGDFFSIQRFLERNLFLTKQHLIAMVCQWIFWAKKKYQNFPWRFFLKFFLQVSKGQKFIKKVPI